MKASSRRNFQKICGLMAIAIFAAGLLAQIPLALAQAAPPAPATQPATNPTTTNPTATHPLPARPLVGAIRWDAWTAWDYYQKFLTTPQWRDRLPFYAQVTPEGGVTIRGDSPEVMGREIGYAHNAGIDYWAWCWYDPSDPDAGKNHMNDCLDIYRAHPRRAEVNYCLIGPGYYATTHWPLTVERFVAMFREPNYQKVMGNRPLFYYFMVDDAVAHFGSVEKARAAIDALRAASRAAGLGNPYIVATSFYQDKGAKAVDELGLDAIGSYCNPPAAEKRELAYAELAGLNRWFWGACKATGKSVIPPINAGWDPRPRLSMPGLNPATNWSKLATPAELAAHVNEALTWVRANPATCPADTVLIYAWNEFDEGGWLCPTRGEGTARLDALRQILRPAPVATVKK